MSNSSAHGVNSLTIGEGEYLLVVAGGSAVHLAAEAQEGEDRRPAAYSEDLDSTSPAFNPEAAGYDRVALTATRWRPTTLCGREWGIMAGGELGPIYSWSSTDREPELTPTCRVCLRSIDRLFPPPATDDRVQLLVELATDSVVQYGSAEITGIPGDQLPAFRTQVRQELRRRGFRSNTHVHERICLVVSEEAHEAIPKEVRDRREREFFASFDPLRPPSEAQAARARNRPWHFHWDTLELPS